MTELPPQPDTVLGPPPPAPKKGWPRSTKIVIGILGVVVALGVIGTLVTEQEPSDEGGGSGASSCEQPTGAWLATLQSGFYKQYQDVPITASGYVEADTSEGKAYYVAVRIEGVDGVAVFGTSEPPLQSDPGLIAAANSAASRLSDLGADIPDDSPAGALLLDDDATLAAESCG